MDYKFMVWIKKFLDITTLPAYINFFICLRTDHTWKLQKVYETNIRVEIFFEQPRFLNYFVWFALMRRLHDRNENLPIN